MNPIEHLRVWWVGRDYIERPCQRTMSTGDPEPCPNTYVRRVAHTAGHDDFCSHDCAVYQQNNAAM